MPYFLYYKREGEKTLMGFGKQKTTKPKLRKKKPKTKMTKNTKTYLDIRLFLSKKFL